MDRTDPLRPAPQQWVEALDRADAEVDAGRVAEVDLDDVVRELREEAAAMRAARRGGKPSAALSCLPLRFRRFLHFIGTTAI